MTLDVSEVDILNGELLLYPNPVKDKLTIQFNTVVDDTVKIDIFDMKGQQIYTLKTDLNENKVDLDLSAMSSGVYLVSIEMDTKTIIKRILLD